MADALGYALDVWNILLHTGKIGLPHPLSGFVPLCPMPTFFSIPGLVFVMLLAVALTVCLPAMLLAIPIRSVALLLCQRHDGSSLALARPDLHAESLHRPCLVVPTGFAYPPHLYTKLKPQAAYFA